MAVFSLPESSRDDRNSLPGTVSVGARSKTTKDTTVTDPKQVATGGQSQPQFDWKHLDLASMLPRRNFSVRALIIPRTFCQFAGYPKGEPCGSWFKVDGKDASDESEPTRIWAIGPGEQLPGFDMLTNKIHLTVFFDPADDRLVIINKSVRPVYCKRLCTGTTVDILVNQSDVITPGEWEFSTDPNEWHIQCKVLNRKPLRVSQELGTKRSAAGESSLTKRIRGPVGADFNRITIPRGSFPDNPLLDIVRGESVHIGTAGNNYTLKLLEPIADGRLASSYKAEHSKILGKLVAIKIIKPNSRRTESTIEAIETWMGEFSIHSTLGSHYAIVPYLGCDARFNALFTEYVDAKSLIYHVNDQSNRRFNGNIVRAWRILCDVASALSFLHASNIVHGDIRLSNILFDPVRGAVLANFSLSFKVEHKAVGHGLPWYLPPEFLDKADAHSTAMDMWALGVVMMWLLGKIPMPESTKHWEVEDVHLAGAPTHVTRKAETRMEDWLATVQAGNDKLQGEGGEMANVVNALVQQNKHERIDAEKLIEELAKCNLQE